MYPKHARRRRIATAIEPLEPRRLLSPIFVSNLNDSGPGSLRAAIAEADGNTGIIKFQSGLSGDVELSTVGDDSYGPSALSVTNAMTIEGPLTGGGITITLASGAPDMRLFAVAADGNLTLDNLTLSGGIASGGAGGSGGRGGGGGGAGLGGAIFNTGSLTINDSTFVNNQAVGGVGGAGGTATFTFGGSGGGGLLSAGSPGSTIGPGGIGGGPNAGAGGTSSSAGSNGGFGGGGGGGPAESINPTTQNAGNGGFGGGGGARGFGEGPGGDGGFGGGGGYGNSAGIGGFGGGNEDTDSFAGGGGAGMGGAIFNDAGQLDIANSTFTANTAQGGMGGGNAQSGNGLGGAIFNYNGNLSLLSSTISLNTADAGRGIYNLGDAQTSTSIVMNSILAQSDTDATDYVDNTINNGSAVSDGQGDLIGSNTGFGGTIVSSADTQLGALSNNGGPTETMLPGPSSPALGAGVASLAAGLPTDQRGLVRIVNSSLDIGSVETTAAAPAITSPNSATLASTEFVTFQFTATGSPSCTLTETGTLPNGFTFTNTGNGTAMLSGTTTQDGNFTLNLTAANGSLYTAEQTFTLTIDSPPVIQSAASESFLIGQDESFKIKAIVNPAPVILEAGTLPPGISFLDKGNGRAFLTGTAAAGSQGVYTLTFSATNAAGTTQQVFTLTVAQLPTLIIGEQTQIGMVNVLNPDGSTALSLTPFPTTPTLTPVAVMADLRNNNVPDLIVAESNGASPLVEIYNANTGALLNSFMAEPASYTGGLSLAIGDVTDNGTPDIIVGMSQGGVPRVRIYDGSTLQQIDAFLAYPRTFTGGVRVASLDFNADGFDDVATAPGPGAAEPVEIFSGQSLTNGGTQTLNSFYPFGSNFTDGVWIAAGQINSTPDIIAGQDTGGSAEVGIFTGLTGDVVEQLQPFPGFAGAVHVGFALADDGETDILAAAGKGNTQLDIFSPTGTLLDSIQAGRVNSPGGRFAT